MSVRSGGGRDPYPIRSGAQVRAVQAALAPFPTPTLALPPGRTWAGPDATNSQVRLTVHAPTLIRFDGFSLTDYDPFVYPSKLVESLRVWYGPAVGGITESTCLRALGSYVFLPTAGEWIIGASGQSTAWQNSSPVQCTLWEGIDPAVAIAHLNSPDPSFSARGDFNFSSASDIVLGANAWVGQNCLLRTHSCTIVNSSDAGSGGSIYVLGNYFTSNLGWQIDVDDPPFIVPANECPLSSFVIHSEDGTGAGWWEMTFK